MVSPLIRKKRSQFLAQRGRHSDHFIPIASLLHSYHHPSHIPSPLFFYSHSHFLHLISLSLISFSPSKMASATAVTAAVSLPSTKSTSLSLPSSSFNKVMRTNSTISLVLCNVSELIMQLTTRVMKIMDCLSCLLS